MQRIKTTHRAFMKLSQHSQLKQPASHRLLSGDSILPNGLKGILTGGYIIYLMLNDPMPHT